MSWKKVCLNLHYNGANRYLFVKGAEIIKFKANDSETAATPLCVGNISKDWSVDNMKNWIKWVCLWFVDYDAIVVNDILDIQNYLMT